MGVELAVVVGGGNISAAQSSVVRANQGACRSDRNGGNRCECVDPPGDTGGH